MKTRRRILCPIAPAVAAGALASGCGPFVEVVKVEPAEAAKLRRARTSAPTGS